VIRRCGGSDDPGLDQQRHAGQRKHTGAELTELFSVARSTVYRVVQRAREPKTVPACRT